MEQTGGRTLQYSTSSTSGFLKAIAKNWQLHLLVLVPLLFVLFFNYGPLYGIQMAFKDFSFAKGVWGSPWVGFKHFLNFFNSYNFARVMGNTFGLSIAGLAVSFPAAILFALGLNELTMRRYKKVVQLVTYAPNFISTTVIVGLLMQLLDPRVGPVNQLINLFGHSSVNFMAEPTLFIPVYVLSDVWQYTGFGAIIYIAALTSIDPQLSEAAVIDGANKVQRIWHVDIPGILPTIVIMFILSMGNLINVGFEKIFLMQNPLNLSSSEVIMTYVYKTGLGQMQYGYSTAVGLFNSLINFVLLLVTNSIAKRLNETSLF